MSEISMRNTMKDHYNRRFPGGHWQRIEDGLQAGIPDINLAAPGGYDVWVEAKQMDAHKLPKRPNTAVKLGLKKEQRLWLDQRSRAGGRVYVVAKIGDEWFVFDKYFLDLQNGITLGEMRFLAKHNWRGKFIIENIF